MDVFERGRTYLRSTQSFAPEQDSPPKSPELHETPQSTLFPFFESPATTLVSPCSSPDRPRSSLSAFWSSAKYTRPDSSFNRYFPAPRRFAASRRQVVLLLCIVFFILFWISPSPQAWRDPDTLLLAQQQFSSPYHNSRPSDLPSDHNKRKSDAEQWLKKHSDNALGNTGNKTTHVTGTLSPNKPRAAIISLVRNSELEGIMQSMRQLEWHWNHKYKYPWIFFSEEPFSDDFKAATANLTSAHCYYEMVPKEHWSLPEWIDEGRFMNSLEYLDAIGVGKGYMVSYRHMCRWNSGFFYRHPRLMEFDYYWRVEPDVHFFCDINYDVFRFMRDNGMKYGFNMNILDDARSFPSLWSETRAFMDSHPDLIHPDADLDWLLDAYTGRDYNNCQFFSNFEIGDLNYFRSEANSAYFDWLDHSGGFYYERFGDAPIHTLSVAMFIPKSEVWFFRDIGYQHDINRHCPLNGVKEGTCSCQPTEIDENFYKLVPLESPQRKPDDSCLRLWLGNEWLRKKEGWDVEAEKAFGGDGYGGYVLDGRN